MQKRCSSSVTTPQPGQRGGSAKSTTCLAAKRAARMAICIRTLFPSFSGCTSPAMTEDKPFDRHLRRLRRDRAAAASGDAAYLHRLAADELVERLQFVKREFRDALDLGSGDASVADRLRQMGINSTRADAGRAFAGRGGAYSATKIACPSRIRASTSLSRSECSTP
jgi:hypothetical protein